MDGLEHQAKRRHAQNDHLKHLRLKNVRKIAYLCLHDTCTAPRVRVEHHEAVCARCGRDRCPNCFGTASLETTRGVVHVTTHAWATHAPQTHSHSHTGTPGASLILWSQRLPQKGWSWWQVYMGQLGG